MFDIYTENKPYISDDERYKLLNDRVSKMIEDKELYYLKPVVHKGVEMSVTLIIDDFVKYYRNDNVDENDLKSMLYTQLFKASIEALVRDACGAFTITMAFDKECGLFNKNATNQTGECIVGFLILIDKRIKKYMPIDGVIYHEYYHCMKENGLLSYNYTPFLKEGKTNYTYGDVVTLSISGSHENQVNVGLDPEEEIEADNFARENIPGGRLCLYRLPKVYCDMNNIHNIFKIMSVNLSLNNYFLSTGRKIFK